VNAGRVDPTGTIPLADRVPYPGYTGILLATTNGHGIYNGGTLSLTKKLSQGLSLLANYTYSKSIDDSSSELNFTYRPELGRKGMRGPSDFDITHRVVLSYIYELPVGKGQRYVNKGGVVNGIIGGWELAGISTFMTGPPATVALPTDWALRGPLDYTWPNCVGNPNEGSIKANVRKNGLEYFNTSAFQLPAPFTLGNCGRNGLRSAGINNWDTSLHKRFPLTERFNLETRFEFFNAWNHAQWEPFAGGGTLSYGQPGYGNPSFGQVTAARAPRTIQLGMKLIF
jgi:hypothetical protein